MAELAALRPQLRVVTTNPYDGWVPRPVIADLAAHPFRPGETPTLVTVVLDEELRAAVATSSAAVRLPSALWLRIAVESARCSADVADALGWTVDHVHATCRRRRTAQASEPGNFRPLATVTLGGYADLLEAGSRTAAVPADGLTLRLSDEMYGAWSLAAGRRGRVLAQWVADMAAAAPADCVLFEISAARSAQTLAEWIYASALRAAASSIA